MIAHTQKMQIRREKKTIKRGLVAPTLEMKFLSRKFIYFCMLAKINIFYYLFIQPETYLFVHTNEFIISLFISENESNINYKKPCPSKAAIIGNLYRINKQELFQKNI